MTPFVHTEQRPRKRSPIDVLHLLGGSALLLIGLLIANTFDSAFVGLREDGQSILESMPEWLADAPAAMLSVGLIATVALAVLWTLATHRYRRLIQILAAAALAAIASYGLGQLVEAMVDQQARDVFIIDGTVVDDPILRITTTSDGVKRVEPGDMLLAGSVAALSVASTWMMRRRSRQLGVALAFTAVLTTLTTGVSALTLIIDVAVGIMAAAIVFLISKRHDPALLPSEIIEASAEIGYELVDLRIATTTHGGPRPWIGTTADGRTMLCKTLSRDDRSADLLTRGSRWFRLRRSGDQTPFLSMRRAAEHEALVALQAGSLGVATPRVLGVGEAGLNGVVILFEIVDGTSLAGADDIDDTVLVDVWHMVRLLHEHRIAHRSLRPEKLILDPRGGVHLTDFGLAEIAAPDHVLAGDVAELLASTAAVVGDERAVSSAYTELGVGRLEMAIPWIQPVALSGETRTAIGGAKGLKALRGRVIDDCDIADEPLERIQRLSSKTILIMVTLALSALFLLPQLADLDTLLDQVRGAEVSWIAIAVVFSLITYLGATVSLLAAIPSPIAFGGALQAQLASSFANRVTPAKVGGVATNIRYFQKQSVPVPVAVSAVGINGVAGLIVHILLTTFFFILAGRSDVDTPVSLPSTMLLIGVLVGILALSALIYALPWGRRLWTTQVAPNLLSVHQSIALLATRPLKLAALFGGSMVITLSYTAAFAASLRAFGSDVSLPVIAVLFLSGSAVAQAAPTPGGLGATEAALVAALSTVEDPAIVVPAVFLYRLVTFWLPILPGWLAMTNLQRRDLL